MRWYETAALILIGALSLGAYLFGTEAVATRLFSTGIDRAFHDTYYLVAHRHYMLSLAAILLGGAVTFGLILWLGNSTVRLLASAAITLWGLAIAVTVLPQFFVSLQGMPRRYIDPPDTIIVWNAISNTASLLAAFAALAMIILLIIALVQRLRRRSADTAST